MDCHLYVGSTTGRYGLEGRKIRHEHINAARNEPSLHHYLLVDPSNLGDGAHINAAPRRLSHRYSLLVVIETRQVLADSKNWTTAKR